MKVIAVNSKGEERIVDVISTLCNIDFVKGTDLYKGSPMKLVMIQTSDDLALPILETYEPGTISFTVGFTSMWQKGVDGNWIPLSQT